MADLVARAVLIDKMSAGLKNIRDQYDKTKNNAKQGSKEFSTSVSGANKSIISLKGALTGLALAGVGVFTKSIISASAEMEGLETKFKVLLGDVDSAKARMQELSKFAQTTPFQLTEVANASRVLQTLGGTALATGDSLRMVGDASAISGESFENLAVHIGRAYSGLQANRPIGESLARLQELGLVSGQTRNKIEELTKQAKGKDAWNILQTELMKTKGGMKELSSTFNGLTSTLKDQFQSALRQIGSGGLFDSAKEGLAFLVNKMNEWIDSGVFLRIGAGFNYLGVGAKAMSQVVMLGFQRIGETAMKYVSEAIGNIGIMLESLPKSIVPDGWAYNLKIASKTLNMMYEEARDGADEMQANALDNLSKMTTAYGQMTGSVKISVKKYTETIKEADKVEDDLSKKNKYRLEREKADKQAHQDFMSQFERDAIDTRREVSLALLSDEDRLREELRIKQQERINMLGQTDNVILLNKKETAELEKQIADDKYKHYEQIFEKEKSIEMARLNLAMAVTSSLATISRNALGSSRKNAKARKGIALAEAVVNTSLGVTKALSSSAPPLNLINAGIVSAQGLAQVSTIATQKFAQGGIVKGGGVSDIGDKTLIRVNAGEGVFTKEQMKAMGERSPINIAPNITINGNADQNAINQMNRGLQKFSDAIIEAIRGGELDLVNELNLVTQ